MTRYILSGIMTMSALALLVSFSTTIGQPAFAQGNLSITPNSNTTKSSDIIEKLSKGSPMTIAEAHNN